MREALISETDLVPYSPSEPVGERVLVLAPHPDDESIGMGGTIRLLTGSGKSVKVVVLTGGEGAIRRFMISGSTPTCVGKRL